MEVHDNTFIARTAAKERQKNVEIFQTDVNCPELARNLTRIFSEQCPHYLTNFDLEDRQRIFRVEASGIQIDIAQITQLMDQQGQYCEWIV